jgi:hypothetical protein
MAKSKGAKKVTEYSRAKEALERQKETLDKTLETSSANGASEQAKKAAQHAQSQYDTSKANVNRLGFKQIGGARTTKAIVSIRAIGKLANRRAYNFGESDVAKIIGLLKDETKSLETKFNAALSGTSAAKSDVSVSFD